MNEQLWVSLVDAYGVYALNGGLGALLVLVGFLMMRWGVYMHATEYHTYMTMLGSDRESHQNIAKRREMFTSMPIEFFTLGILIVGCGVALVIKMPLVV